MNQSKYHKKSVFTVHVLAKGTVGRITACSQLVEGVVVSRLPATPSPEPPLPSSDSCSAFQPSGTCWLYPEVFSLLILVGGTSLSNRVFTVPRGNHYLFPKGDLFYPLTFPQKLLYNLLQGFSRSSLKPPESRSWVWARNSQCIVCHF